ncbi:MAG: type II toxin-antitoxin system RelE/ParE family toxin [Burkholderiales bacterium]|nr:type II toxin-antitoxin system RelE/ParE family toxin [Burkholderiales bacterium]
MAQVTFTATALEDLERIREFHGPEAACIAAVQIEKVLQATRILHDHPMVGRVVRREVRELVISHGGGGFLALYRFYPQRDLVRVLHIRHQRELGYGE